MALVDCLSTSKKKQVQFIRIVDGTPDITIKFTLAFLFGATINGSITARIRDPHHPYRDERDMVEISETELVRQLNLMDGTRADREPAYRDALEAVQRAKFRAGLKRETPLITAETTFGKPKIVNPSAEPR